MLNFKLNALVDKRLITTSMVVISLFILFCPTLCISQDSTSITILEEAKTLHRNDKFNEARIIYKQIISNFVVAENWKKWDECFFGINRTSLYMDDLSTIKDSLPIYIKTLPKNESLLLAKCYARRAGSLLKFGNIYAGCKGFEEALFAIKEVKESAETKEVHDWKNHIYKQLGNANSQLGDNNTAIKHAEDGLRYAYSKKDTSNIRNFIMLIGKYSFHNNQTDIAISKYKEVLEKFDSGVYLHQYFAEAYLALDSLDLAKKHLDLSEHYLENSKNPMVYFNQLAYKSQYYHKKGNYDIAFQLKQKELDSLKVSNRHRFYLRELVTHAQNLYDHGDFSQSILLAQEALQTHYRDLDTANIMDRPILDENLPDIHIIEALYIKAKYFNQKYGENYSAKYLTETTFYYETLLRLFDKLKSKYNSPNSQYRIGGYTKEIYSEAILFYTRLYHKTNDTIYFEKAFQLTQNANAYVLKNSVNERKRFELANIPKDSINKYYDLKSMANNEDSEENGTQHLEIFNIYKDSLYSQYPSIKKFEDNQIIELSTLQNSLKSNEILIKYYHTSDLLIRFAISSLNIEITEITLPQDFLNLTNDIQALVSDNKNWNEQKYASKTKRLYDLILDDLLKKNQFSKINHLIIAPDGPLKSISFSSLVQKNISDLIQVSDYLIHDYEVSYVYYCAQLNANTQKVSNRKKFIGFGLEYNDELLEKIVEEYLLTRELTNQKRTASVSKLKYATKEAVLISSILGGDVVLNDAVIKSEVLHKINDYKIAHFSAHAFINKEDYLNSFIVLNLDDEGDFQLKYKDILNLNLNSEMVVLSACQTGSGTNIIGEGLMSLSRAFIQSGCKSSIGSYWNASDKTSMELMELFYINLNNGMTKSAALKKAQLTFLINEKYHSPRSRIPFYWSSWAIYGDTSPIESNSSFLNSLSNPYMILISVFCLLGLVILYFRHNKKVQ